MFLGSAVRRDFEMALALGIYGCEVCGRLNLTTATPYYATGLSQSESITGRQVVAESTIMPVGSGAQRLSVRPVPLQSLSAETARAAFGAIAAPLEPL